MHTDRIGGEATLLQNGYAFAIDTRDWDRFRDLFTPDVLAVYPLRTYGGIDEWLEAFVPFHAACRWTLHTMTNHLHGEDSDGVWRAWRWWCLCLEQAPLCWRRTRWSMREEATLQGTRGGAEERG